MVAWFLTSSLSQALLHLPGTHLAFLSEWSIKAVEMLTLLLMVLTPIYIRYPAASLHSYTIATSRRRIVCELY
ncbi:hypothetical protein COCSADRAFT_223312 [Bipolaris sorokiniana ND90Pr]|uniref:Uncharacterized protein n=1 Tax=Cochliobolus sativus (strain ND90Pr / ATCC 201652) TaxID=665912 RepID=M2SK41_COCSN|nr:uncharacterized protein COCSADRAFT_223312 [Bipolaris sorokiniana ND90Pr]EMD62680.1 hypothetical protein COCSADRAFT_223312 [Bipolaris sorokiniana ND90Pr]